ncbi:hypothetical protein V6N11_082460 [Hibiscus sabdariffa]|uniref:Uncharacterized protein n=2 Tax=Hibiscus sabdariffa TaxID=183260 RepID=A0ABR2BTJ7_9ROSI
MARYKPRQAFWRRVCQVNPENSKGSCIFSGNGGVGGPSEEPKQNENKNPEEDGKEKGECSTKNTGNCKRVVGFKDESPNKVSVQKNGRSARVYCSNSSVESSSDLDRSKSPELSSASSSQSGKPKRLSNVNSSVMDSLNANLLESGPNGLGNINAAVNISSEKVNNIENENLFVSDEENNMSKKDIPTPRSPILLFQAKMGLVGRKYWEKA